MEEFYRIRRLPPYVFEQVNRAKAARAQAGADIIDLGMGNPDLPTPAHVVEKLKETVGKPRTDRYSASQGHPGLRRAQAAYYARRFGVKLNPDTQVVTTLGSKEGFANVAQAITAPGDVILVPNPSYPIHAFGFLMAGGVIRSVPVGADDDFFRALERAVMHSIPKPIAVVVCYPSNPTAYVADLDFYRDLVAFAKKHELLVLSDLAYAEVYFDDNPPPSVLQVPGAMDVAVEFTSMSKTYSMPGWRIGFAVGNERIIAALARVKSYLDYGAFTPIQVAATAALNGPDDCIDEMRDIYERRRDALVECFGRAGWAHSRRRAASMFAWAPIPEPFRTLGSVEFSTLLVEKADVAVSPGVGFGEHGEGYVRIALVENEQRIRQAARNIRRFLETGAGNAAQRRSPRDAALVERRSSAGSATFHGRAAESRSCRPRHRRQLPWSRLIDDASATSLPRAAAAPIEVVAVTRALAQQEAAASICRNIRWVADPVALARDPADRRLRRAHRRRRRSRQERGRGGARSRQACRHRQQGAARRARRRRSPRSPSSSSVALNFEAAVAGGIPIVKTLREGSPATRSTRIYGILNGTCNYILTRMEQERLAFADCLAEAQRLGYAEADPTFDIDGHDTAQKLAILASLAFGTEVDPEAIYVEGISSITLADLEAADELGYRIKLLGVAVKHRRAASSSACTRPWCRRNPPSPRSWA